MIQYMSLNFMLDVIHEGILI